MFTRILIPVDFSAPSGAALTYARRLAHFFDATVHLLHVSEGTFLRAMVSDPGDRDTAVLNRLDALLADEDHRRLRVVTAVEHSDVPADEIVRYADLEDTDLIVMGTHGHTGLTHVLLGSVAETVVRRAGCPVLTLRALPQSFDTSHSGPRRILAATDFSPPSDEALECARAMADRCGASLHLLHVLEDIVDTAAFGTEVFVPDSPEVRAARLAEARDRLTRRAGTAPEGPRATTDVIVGASARAIAAYAAEGRFDLIVVGTHGRTGFAHLVMGSVAEQVVRTAPCPVLCARHAPNRGRSEDRSRADVEPATNT